MSRLGFTSTFSGATAARRRPAAICVQRRAPVFAAPAAARRAASRLPIRASLSVEEAGEKETMEYRVFVQDGNGGRVSPWNDIPLYANDDKTLVNFVNEIPRGTTAKMEIATDEAFNPIKQDIKKGALRFYKYGPSLINYGALPQTWEDPDDVNPDTQCGGDDDPVDLLDIGSETMPMGAVYTVKPFGVLALLDEGETDWKVLAINVADPKADLINSVADANVHFPGAVDAVREWFRNYKTAEGKGVNEYAFNGDAKDAAYTMKVIADTHASWQKLRDRESS